MIDIARYKSKVHTSPIVLHPNTLDDICSDGFLAHHVITDDKESVGLFALVTFIKGQEERAESNIATVNGMVFDADAGPMDDCRTEIRRRKLWAHEYTTHSHNPPVKHARRLILKYSRPVTPAEHKTLWLILVKELKVPASAVACKGASHAYYEPAHPAERAHLAEIVTTQGQPLDVDEFLKRHIPQAKKVTAPPVDFTLPPEPTEPVDLEPLRNQLAKRQRSLAHMKDDVSRAKAKWLKALLDCEPLAGHGERNEAVWRTCGLVVFAAPNQSIGTYKSLIMPSVQAMIAAGSSVTEDDVERALFGSMRTYAQQQADRMEFERFIESRSNRPPNFKPRMEAVK